MSAKPLALTDAEFDPFVTGAKLPLIVDFWAPWCPPCRRLGPYLEKFAAELDGTLLIAKVNTDENSVHADRFDVKGFPTLLFLDRGQPVHRVVGAPSYVELREQIVAFLGRAGKAVAAVTDRERQYALAVLAAETAFSNAVTPARQILLAALEPLREEFETAIARAASELAAQKIDPTQHEADVEAARQARDAAAAPHRLAYNAVTDPAEAAFLEALVVASEAFFA